MAISPASEQARKIFRVSLGTVATRSRSVAAERHDALSELLMPSLIVHQEIPLSSDFFCVFATLPPGREGGRTNQ
jgi:hypothetical protein